MSFRVGPSTFKDASKLSFDYVPEKLVHRERQIQRLFNLFRPLADTGMPANAFLWGPVGTGKTHSAKRFCVDFARYAGHEKDRAIEYAFVNCRQRMGDDAVLLAILKRFDARFPDRGFSIPEKLEILRKHLEKRRSHLIVALDEVDTLLKKTGSNLIYAFSRFAEEGVGERGDVSLILISQLSDTLDRMDAAARSTFRRTNAVEFPTYDRDELIDIAADRVKLAFHPGAVSDEIVGLIADIAAEFGDARYAIDLLQHAGMLADEEGVEEIAAEHVRGAKATVRATDVEDRIRQLDRSKRIALLAIARKIRRTAYITTGDAEKAYAVACEEYGEKPRGHTQFWKYLKDLDALGLIDTKISGEGTVGKTTVISLPEVPARLLAEQLEASLKGSRRD